VITTATQSDRLQRVMSQGTLAIAALALLAAGSAANAATPPHAAATAGTPTAAGAPASGPHGLGSRAARKKTPPVPIERIDINGANLKQLMTLPGIGQAEARKIIANRPYLSKAELVHKGVLPTGPYLSLKDRIIALQKKPLKARP
jgi:DNA uptake protein ComE-like DNA-binding protein